MKGINAHKNNDLLLGFVRSKFCITLPRRVSLCSQVNYCITFYMNLYF